jgi:hypothetical protein
MGRFQNNPSIGWLHPKFTHAHPLVRANRRFTCKPITLSIQPTFDFSTLIPTQKVFPQCLYKTKPTKRKDPSPNPKQTQSGSQKGVGTNFISTPPPPPSPHQSQETYFKKTKMENLENNKPRRTQNNNTLQNRGGMSSL